MNKTMTVTEIIEQLSKLPADKEIRFNIIFDSISCEPVLHIVLPIEGVERAK